MRQTVTGTSRRIVLLDEIRGLCLVLMVIYHGLYNLTFLFGVPISFYSLPLNALQLFICCNFILISGVSCRLSRNNLGRGIIVFAIAMGMTVATYFAMPEQIVVFGILHFLGLCMIFYGLLHTGVKSNTGSGLLGLILCVCLFALTWGAPRGYIGIFSFRLLPVPDILYSTPFTFFLGLPHIGFYSSDYFPLLPWVFLFFAGTNLGIIFSEGSIPGFFYHSRSRFLSMVGKRTLVIYVLHQPVLYGVMYAFFWAFNKI